MVQSLSPVASFSSNLSLILECTSRREPQLQFSLIFQNAEASTSSTISSKGASSKTTCGLLPPHSSTISLRLLSAAYCRNNLPTSVEPVNETISTSMCRPNASPASSPSPVTSNKAPSGIPASCASCVIR